VSPALQDRAPGAEAGTDLIAVAGAFGGRERVWNVITFLDGLIVEKHPTRLVLEVGGVGYEILIPLSSYDRLPRKGERCRVLTVDYVREDCHQLFGFMSDDERQMFRMLMATSGIGPKLALSALSGLTVRELKAAILDDDASRLSCIPGIGNKTAQRIVVELRDKLDAGDALEAAAGRPGAAASDSRMRDAVMALVALGHKGEAARKMIRAAFKQGLKDETVEEIVRKSLAG
jgi:Holliday junction DNA helicase RuvA